MCTWRSSTCLPSLGDTGLIILIHLIALLALITLIACINLQVCNISLCMQAFSTNLYRRDYSGEPKKPLSLYILRLLRSIAFRNPLLFYIYISVLLRLWRRRILQSGGRAWPRRRLDPCFWACAE